MQLCVLTENDVEQIFQIEKSAYLVPWSEETFQRCFQMNYFSIGAKEENQLLGYVIFSIMVGECHILNLCVDPKHQRQGLGRKLLTQALDIAKEKQTGVAYLEVRRSNSAAIALYNSMSFIQIGQRKNYYPSDKGYEDALVFAKDLGIS